MALDLQFNTAAAVQNLANLDKAVANLRTRLNDLQAADDKVIQLNASLANLKGINPAAASSINTVANALNRLSKNNALTSIAQGLNQLSTVNVTAAAAGVNDLANALRNIKAPTGLTKLGNDLAKIGNEARQGASGVQAMGAAINGIKQPPVIRNPGQPFVQGAQQVSAFNNVLRTTTGILAAFGVQGAAQSVVQFGKNAMDAATEVTQLGLRIKSTGFTIGEQDGLLKGLNATIDKLVLPLDVAYKSFGKLSQGMAAAGFSADDIMGTFEGFGTGLRAFGLNADQMDRAFNAITQTFQKGTVSMEELRQQLGEVFPAFAELAKSMSMSTEDLMALIAQGKVASSTFIKLGQDIKNKYAAQAAEGAQTGQAALQRLYNAFERIQQVVGAEMFNSFKTGLNDLASSLDITNPKVQQLATELGQNLGAAVTYAVQAGIFLAQNFNLIAGAVTALVGIGIARYFFNVGLSIYQAGQYAYGMFTAFQALGGLSGVIATIGSWSPLIASVGSALLSGGRAALSFAASLLLPIAAGVSLAAVGVLIGTAIGSLIQWFQQGGSYTQIFSQNLGAIAQQATGVVSGFVSTVAAATGLGDSFSTTGIAAALAGTKIGEVDTNTQSAAEGLSNVATPAGVAAVGLSDVAQKGGEAGDAIGEVGTSASNAAGSVGSLSANLQGSVNASNSAAAAARNAAAAFRELAAAKASSDGGGSISSRISSFFSRDGLANSSGTGTTTSAPISAFKNAPHFAGGTANTNGFPSSLPGGGIPSVLHPNEAVVPLAGGGSIPISISGGMGGGPQQNGPDGLSITQLILTTLRDMDTNLDRIWESIDAQSVILTNEFSKMLTQLGFMHNTLVTISGNIINGFKNMSGGGSGGGGGGIGGGTGGTLNGAGLSDDLKTFKNQKYSNDLGVKYGITGPNAGGLGYLDSNGKFYAQYELSPDFQNNNAIAQRNNEMLFELFDKYGAQKVADQLFGSNSKDAKYYLDLYGRRESGNIGEPQKFATGSPNASKDAEGGGFMAMLHPDEAVIPLPDGRSVPVELPRSFMDRSINRDAGTRDDRRPMINVTMNIQTPDANSFRASQQQITDKLRGQLERNARTSGPARSASVEDPTRRV